MRKIQVNQNVRTNKRWQKIFATNDVIRGVTTGYWHDRKTMIVRLPDGKEQVIHTDWLEEDCEMTNDQ